MCDIKFWQQFEKFIESKTIETEIDFLTELKKIDLFITTDEDKNLLVIEDESNQHLIPVFTSRDRIKYDFKVALVHKIKFDTIKNIVLKGRAGLDGLLIDPLENKLFFNKENILRADALTKGLVYDSGPKLQGLELKVVKKLRFNLVKELKEYCDNIQNIFQINLYKGKRSVDVDPHYVFLINCIGDKEEIFPYLAEIIVRNLDGRFFELIKVSSEDLNELEDSQKSIIYRK